MEDDRVFAGILNDCLDAIDARQASIEDCLTRYPQHAARLEELLRLSSEVRMVPLPTPTPEMLKAGERRLVQAARSKAADRPREQREGGLLSILPKWFAPAMAASGGLVLLFVCVLVVLLGAGAAWRTFRNDDGTLERPTAAISEREEGQGVPSLPTPTFASDVTQEREEGQGVSSLPTPTLASDVTQDVSPLPSPIEVPTLDDSSRVTYTVYLPLSIKPIPPHMAMIKDVQGIVEVQTDGETWSAVNVHQNVEAGQRVRTGALSSASLAFYDGSIAHLGPGTEISVDHLGQEPSDGSRIVELTQWVGETDHDVASASGDNARYEIHTPSGTGEAKGTFFHVSVTPAQVVRFGVDEGAVTVTHLDVTVVVVAGQLTTVHVDRPPSKPVFRVTGEGEVSQTGPTWTIAGQDFETHDGTVIVGNPQIGDWVSVAGHLLADGTRVADQIVLLRRAPQNRFTITGRVETISDTTWTVAGQVIAVNDETSIEDDIEIGNLVRVEGIIILEGGTFLAEYIRLVEEEPGWPFHFVGVVQTISDTTWTVSDVTIAISDTTEIDKGLLVGDVVEARGWILDDGTWLARSIKRFEEGERWFEFTGYVEIMGVDGWVVSGIPFETRDWTEIEADIGIGERVKVRGQILEDGTRIAYEIERFDDDVEAPYVVFVGVVTSTDPWIVSGIRLAVDDETVIAGHVGRGDLVKVWARILPDSTWLAKRIKRVGFGPGLGCFSFSAVIIGIDGDRLMLADGETIDLGGVIVEGEVEVGAVILVFVCVDADGTVTVVSIIVIYIPPPPPPPSPPSPPPAPPPPPLPPPAGGSPIVVNENNQTQTFTCSGHSVTINGNDNTITLLGSCGPVTIRGNSNWVSIQSATSVTNTGNNNTIVGP